MSECIICRLEKEYMSDEHVIPDSLGGYYHIYNVCKTCNSDLGSLVDSKLVNHLFSDFMRYLNDIKGKKSSIPNPFSGTHVLKDNPSRKVQLRLNKENKPQTYFIPEVTYKKNNRGIVESFQISIDGTDKNKLQGMVDKISKRLGIKSKEIDIKKIPSIIGKSPMVHAKVSVDIKDFRIGLLKIAYEFAVDNIPEYYDDKTAKQISNSLFNADLNLLNSNTFIGSGLDKEIKNSLDFLLDFSSKKHYLVIINIKGHGLICLIYLYNLFSIGIRLSDNENILHDNWLLGINDITNKNFRVLSASNAIEEAYSEPEIRFCYFFKTETEAVEFQKSEKAPGFDFYTKNGETPVFDESGKLLHDNIHQKMKSLEEFAFPVGDTKKTLINEVEFDENLYLRIIPLNKLIKVISAREERYLIHKL